MIAGIYCRVSTDCQEREGTSLQTQLEACLKYCASKGYEVPHRFSEAYSGLTLDRPKLNELRELVRAEQIDVIICYCVDRLSRNATHGVLLRDEADRYHVLLESVTEDIDKTPLGEAITYLRGTFAQIEAMKIKERTQRGKAFWVCKGRLPSGTGIGLFGYKWDTETKKRLVIEFEAKVVERIFTMIAGGKSLFVVAKEFNQQNIPTKGSKPGKMLPWHPLTIRRIVRNQAYTGKTYFGTTHRISRTKSVPVPQDQWKLLPDVTPAIISQELFDRANAELAKPKLRPGRAIQPYLLKGHAFCLKCGSPLIGSWLSKRYRYYQCSGARPTASRGKVCDSPYIRADWLEDTTWAKVRAILQDPALVLEQVRREIQTAQKGGSLDSIDADMATIEHRVRSYPGQKRRLLQAFKIDAFEKNDILDELNRLQHDMESDLKVQAELQQAKATLVNLAQAEVKVTAFCQNANYNLENCSTENKRIALGMLDIKAQVSKNHLEIKGVIPEEFVTIEQTSA